MHNLDDNVKGLIVILGAIGVVIIIWISVISGAVDDAIDFGGGPIIGGLVGITIVGVAIVVLGVVYGIVRAIVGGIFGVIVGQVFRFMKIGQNR